MFFTVALAYISINSGRRVRFLHILSSIYLFFRMTVMTGVRWYLSVVLICISLKASNAEHLFTCLLVVLGILWRNGSLSLSLIFLTGLFVFYGWVVWAVCVFWKLILCWSHHLQIFSPLTKIKTKNGFKFNKVAQPKQILLFFYIYFPDCEIIVVIAHFHDDVSTGAW